MMAPLHESLFAALLARPDQGLASPHRDRLEAASELAYRQALADLAPHKVLALLSHQLGALGVKSGLPQTAQRQLTESENEARAVNVSLLLSVASVLRLARQRGEPQLVVKGMVLADSYYPDFGTRPMGDVDLVARPGCEQALFEILADAGFVPSHDHAVQEDGVTYVNQAGALCDAHRVLRMFSGQPWDAIVRQTELSKLRGLKVLILEPNAMIAHLIVHMQGHLREIGPVLLWIVDLAFVLRRHLQELDVERLRALSGSEEAWVFALRAFRLLQDWGEGLPSGLHGEVRLVPPLSLGGILRQRRMIPWGLPKPAGWARLLLSHMSLRDYAHKPRVHIDDLLLWPTDEVLRWVAPRLARVRT